MMMIGCGKKEKSEPRYDGPKETVKVDNIVIGNNNTVKIGEAYTIEFDFTAEEELTTLSILWKKTSGDGQASIATTDNQLAGKKSGHYKHAATFSDAAAAGTWRLSISGNLPKAAVSFDMINETITVVK